MVNEIANFAANFKTMRAKGLIGTTLLLMLISGAFAANPIGNIVTTEPPDKLPEATKDSLEVTLSADIRNRHTWRGGLTCDAWNFQPTLNFTWSNFLVGAWGVYTVDNKYAEVDFYASYTYKSFTLSVLDYFCPNETLAVNRFFDYNDQTTPHLIDINLQFNGTKSFPVRILASTIVYGNDKKADDPNKNNYSTYFEAGYNFASKKGFKYDFVVGLTPFESFYSNRLNVVNMGFKASKKIKITPSYSLPVFGQLVLNPYKENLHFVFGITIE